MEEEKNFKIKIFTEAARCSYLTAFCFLSEDNFDLTKAFMRHLKEVLGDDTTDRDLKTDFKNSRLLQDFFGTTSSDQEGSGSPDMKISSSIDSCFEDEHLMHRNQKSPEIGSKRKIFIDGSNVAIGYSKYLHGQTLSAHDPNNFSVEGLEKSLKYFIERGFETKAIIPQYRMGKERSSNRFLLRKLEDKKLIVSAPPKCYDDLVLLKCAKIFDGTVVSNDKFRDLKGRGFDKIINERVLRFKIDSGKFLIDESNEADNEKILYFQ